MSGSPWLDWAILATSLYNAIILLWLGLTILLNAEERHLGIWLAGGGLLAGAAFFLSHSAILVLGLSGGPAVDFWWRLAMILVILAPFTWYVVMLWYAGFWEGRPNPLQHRHRLWLWLLGLLTVALLDVTLIANPLPSLEQMSLTGSGGFQATPAIYALAVLYPLFIVACIGLALEALLLPGPTVRLMGQQARQRSRPWLAGASGALLLVSFLVAASLWWVLSLAGTGLRSAEALTILAWADLVIGLLIAAAVSLTGQAIVSYEIFTGRTLPRRGLLRSWQQALILALGYSLVTGLSLSLGLPAIYPVLLSACLLVLFYALSSWRSYIDRERFIADLRPFMASPQLYNGLLRPASPSDLPDVQETFAELCGSILQARLAFLAPIGPLAALFGPPLSQPPGPTLPDLEQIMPRFTPAELCLPLRADDFGGAIWAVPLWNERGLCGALLLGEKLDGGFYTQEEIELARSAGERLVDTQASAEMARRLMALQRQQLAESQVLDRRARRLLHDDVLPLLHAAMLSLGSGPDVQQGRRAEALSLLGEAHRQVSNLLRDLPVTLAPEVARLGLVSALRWVVEQEMKGAFDRVDWLVEPGAEQVAGRLQPLAAEVVFYAAREALRNAARHARPEAKGLPLRLSIEVRSVNSGLEMAIEDNGVGVNSPASPEAGSGSGLALHSTLLAVVGGSLQIDSQPGEYTCARIRISDGAGYPNTGSPGTSAA
jgi:signal transduction histidine kinase